MKTGIRIDLGDIYWLHLVDEIPHPHVVIQVNESNVEGRKTVVVCALTTNQKKANRPGNVLLALGEGNLEKQSIVEVAKIRTIDTFQLGEHIGTLSESRVSEIWAGIGFLQRSFLAGR